MIKYTKLLSGKVSASDFNDDIALADISAAMPNMSGGAVLIKGSECKYLLGIHLGVFFHEKTTHKQIEEVEQLPSSALVEFLGENVVATLSYSLFMDRIVLTTPAVVENDQSIASPCKEAIPEINAPSAVWSPPGSIRSRILDAMENIPQKGSMSYFVLSDAKKRGLKRNQTTQTSKPARSFAMRKSS